MCGVSVRVYHGTVLDSVACVWIRTGGESGVLSKRDADGEFHSARKTIDGPLRTLAARALRLTARRTQPGPVGARNWWQTAEADMVTEVRRVWKCAIDPYRPA